VDEDLVQESGGNALRGDARAEDAYVLAVSGSLCRGDRVLDAAGEKGHAAAWVLGPMGEDEEGPAQPPP
jgi:hypothetical protein